MNISGFAVLLAKQGLPFAHGLATAGVLIEVFGPLAFVLGLAPRLSAALLVLVEVCSALALHRFWSLGGAARQLEQVLFLTNLGLAAASLFYFVSGPGAWSLGSVWRGGSAPASPKEAQPKPNSAKPRAPKAALAPKGAAA
jgi:putative oxidoreductase